MPRAGSGSIKFLPFTGLILVMIVFLLSWQGSAAVPAIFKTPAVQWGSAAALAVMISVQALLLLRDAFTNPVGRWMNVLGCASYFLFLFSAAMAYGMVSRMMNEIVSAQGAGRMTSLLPALLQKANDPQMTPARRVKAAATIYRISGESIRYETTDGQSTLFTPTPQDEAGRADHLAAEADTAQSFALVKKNLARANDLAIDFMQIFFLTFALGVVVLALRRPKAVAFGELPPTQKEPA